MVEIAFVCMYNILAAVLLWIILMQCYCVTALNGSAFGGLIKEEKHECSNNFYSKISPIIFFCLCCSGLETCGLLVDGITWGFPMP